MSKARTELHGLYVITPDEQPDPARLVEQVAAALRGGARLVQYRDKSGDGPGRERQARELKDLCARHGARLIINDDVGLARAAGADGVHLGQADMPIRQAREILGPGAIIGVTCHDRLDLALAAEAAGADYVAFGAVYPSPTKPDAVRAPLMLFAQAREVLTIPVCAIGGLDADNAAAVIRAGADMVAVVSGVFGRPDPEAEARRLTALCESARDKRQDTGDQ
jgi:thiamine-phosphate pyrophosphorylase